MNIQQSTPVTAAPSANAYALKCGSHWTHITEGFGDEWVVSCDAHRATRFATRKDAEIAKARLESRVYAPSYEIVPVE